MQCSARFLGRAVFKNRLPAITGCKEYITSEKEKQVF